MQHTDFDVAIIGGGPAGSTAAILLARAGRKVVVLEREKFPRFHIGESLLPYSLVAFDRLGVREELDQWAVDKRGGEVATACGARMIKFHFANGFRLKHTRAYQVERSVFDEMLLRRAAKSGAEVREETSVTKADLREDGVTLQTSGGEVRAKYVIDASGRNAVIGQQLSLKQSYEHLKKFSCFAHYENVQRDEGIDAGLTRQSADTFQLVVGTLDFAGKDSTFRVGDLERLLVTLGRDQRVDTMPGDFPVLLSSVSTILKSKPLIESKLNQLVGTPVGDHAEALGTAAQDMYTLAVTRIEQARLMLAVYAVVLLVAVGFIALRLHEAGAPWKAASRGNRRRRAGACAARRSCDRSAAAAGLCLRMLECVLFPSSVAPLCDPSAAEAAANQVTSSATLKATG